MNRFNLTRRKALGLLGSVSAAAFAGGVGAQGLSLQDIGQDFAPLPTVTVYTARRVITMEGNEPEIDAVAVVGERVLAAGPRAAIEARIGDHPYVIDDRFADKVIIGGLIDQHVHQVLAALRITATIIDIEDWSSGRSGPTRSCRWASRGTTGRRSRSTPTCRWRRGSRCSSSGRG